MSEEKMVEINWKQVKKYCEKYGSAKLAAELGYKTSQTIEQWIARKTIPGYMVKQLTEVLANEYSSKGN